MEENKELQELKEDELEQVTGGNTLSTLARIPLGQLAPTSLERAAGLGKSYVVQTAKIEEISKAIAPN